MYNFETKGSVLTKTIFSLDTLFTFFNEVHGGRRKGVLGCPLISAD